MRGHAVRRDGDPAAGLARGHDRARLAPALQAESGARAVHRRERERRDVAALLVRHAVQLDGRHRCERGARAQPGRRARRPSCRRRPARARARPRPAAGAAAAVPAGNTVSWWPSSRMRRPRRRGVRATTCRPTGEGSRSTAQPAAVGPLGDQRCAGIEPLEVAGRRVDRTQPAQALEVGRWGRRGHGGRRGTAQRFRRRAAAAGGCRRASRGSTRAALDAQPVLEQRGVDAAEVGRDDEVVVVVELRSPGNSLRIPPFARLPTSSSRPPAPWSVPPRVVVLGPAAELAPDHREHARGEPARVEVGLPGEQRVAEVLQQVGVRLRPGRRACRSRRCEIVAMRVPKPAPSSRPRLPSALPRSLSG